MIINSNGMKTISIETESADTLFKQTIGLMFRFKITKPLIFELDYPKACDVHMLFVPFSIDVVFLDADDTIIYMEYLKAWTGRVKTPCKVKKIIEYPEFTISEKNLQFGDKLLFI